MWQRLPPKSGNGKNRHREIGGGSPEEEEEEDKEEDKDEEKEEAEKEEEKGRATPHVTPAKINEQTRTKSKTWNFNISKKKNGKEKR